QQRPRPPLVAILLLHAGRQPGVRSQISGRDQARAARDPQSRRSLRRRADAGRAADRRCRVHAQLRLCVADAQGNSVRTLAGLQSRGCGPFLRTAAARGGHDQVESQQDSRRRYGLAPLERPQARTEELKDAVGRASRDGVRGRGTMNEIRYTRWREYYPEDAVRFYSLRLREAAMIKMTPTQIIPRGTDWHFFNELKRELKG